MTIMLGSGGDTPLADALDRALTTADDDALATIADGQAASRRDRLTTLLSIYRLHSAPLELLGPAVRYQHHPAVVRLKWRCEAEWLTELEALALPDATDTDPVAAIRELAARNRAPAIYEWLRTTATWDELVRFLAFEGGPDGAFDDLVAVCQLGLSGSSKLELAVNFWDEMGNGDPTRVHTTLFHQFAEAIDLPHIPRTEQPTSALARTALNGLLTTNRWLQPELLGALGMTELQAGPRCRLVVQALERLDAPDPAGAFYSVHADVDPRHGKDWMNNAIAPEIDAHPDWATRIVRGVVWRLRTNMDFFADMARLFDVDQPTDEAA